MSEDADSNPFAASQIDPGTVEGPLLSDSDLLAIAELECDRMRPWVWVVGIMFMGFSLLMVVNCFIVLIERGRLLAVLVPLVMLCLYGCAGVLILRYASKITEFCSLPRPFQLEEVLVSHAGCWKFLGLVCTSLLGLSMLLVLLKMFLT